MKKAILITFLSILVIFIPVIFFNDSVYIFPGDGIEAYFPFYLGLSSFSSQFWTETITFGSNSFIFMIGFIFSPFLAISSFFNQTTIIELFWIFDFIRFLLMTVFSYLWLTKIAKRQTTKIVGSIMYTFSGFVLYFLHYSPFFDSYILIPLLLYLVEEVFRENKKKLLFTITIMYTILLNAYFFYIISWILVFYFVTRILNIHNFRESFLSFFSKKTFILILYYLVGVGLSAFVLLPVLNIILSNPRLDLYTNQFLRFDIGIKQVYNFISSFYSPIITDYESNIFISKILYPEARISYHFSLIIFTLVFTLNLLEYQKINYNKLVIWIFSYLISFSPFTNLILNGNPYDIRWHIWLVIINIILSIDVIDNIDKYRKKSIVLTFVINSVIILLIMFLSMVFELSHSNILTERIIVVSFIVIVSFFYSIIFIFNSKNFVTLMFCVILVLETMFVLYHRVYENKQATYIDSSNINLSLKEDIEVLNIIQNRDNSFYRIEFVDAMINHPTILNYPGFTSYYNLYNHNVREYLDGRYSSYWIINEVPSKWLSKNLLSAKYLVLDKKNTEYELPFGFDLYFSNSKYYVYINEYATDFGFATNKVYSNSELQNIDKSIQDILFMQAIFSGSSTKGIDLDDFIMPEKLLQNVTNQQIISKSSSGFYLIDYQKTWPYTKCDIEKYQGDLVSEYYTRYEYSYFTLKNNEKFDRVFIYCHSLYTQHDTTPYSVYYFSDEVLNTVYKQKNSFDQVELISRIENGYKASVTITIPKSTIFLTIPFDESWKIEVNGSKHPYENVNDGFIGISIDDVGEYDIQLKYQPKGFVSGVIISIATFLLLVFIYISKHFRIKTKNLKTKSESGNRERGM